MRSLGQFFGHIVKGVRSKVPGPGEPREVSREVREQTTRTEQGRVTIRETVVREIVVEPQDASQGRGACDDRESGPAPKR